MVQVGGLWNFVKIDPSEFPVTAIGSPAITEVKGNAADNVIYDLQGDGWNPAEEASLRQQRPKVCFLTFPIPNKGQF